MSAVYLLSALILYYSFHSQRRKSPRFLFTTTNVSFKSQISFRRKFDILPKQVFFKFLPPYTAFPNLHSSRVVQLYYGALGHSKLTKKKFLYTFGGFPFTFCRCLRHAGQRDDSGQLSAAVCRSSRLVQSGTIPASSTKLEFAFVNGSTGPRLDAHHKARVLFAELHLLRVQRFGQLIANEWCPDGRRCHRTRSR